MLIQGYNSERCKTHLACNMIPKGSTNKYTMHSPYNLTFSFHYDKFL